MSSLNLCIVGCGSIARTHARIARTLRGVTLSFASRDRERAEEYRRKFKGVTAYGSYEEACTASDVDAVFICTPHAYHVEHARLAAGGRKPMIIEKPITRTIEELDEMEAAVTATDTLCMVAENYQFKPLPRVLRDHIDAGDIGDPLFIALNKSGRSGRPGWRMDADLMGGGALLEGGVHWVNLLLNVAGAPVRVTASRPSVRYDMRAPFEDNIQVLVEFENGAVGSMLHSWNTVNRTAGLALSKIYGTGGNIAFESNGVFALVLGQRKRIRIPGLLDIMGYRGMLQAFVDAVREGASSPMSLGMARRDMEFVFAAYRSLESGRFEPVIRPEA